MAAEGCSAGDQRERRGDPALTAPGAGFLHLEKGTQWSQLLCRILPGCGLVLLGCRQNLSTDPSRRQHPTQAICLCAVTGAPTST